MDLWIIFPLMFVSGAISFAVVALSKTVREIWPLAIIGCAILCTVLWTVFLCALSWKPSLGIGQVVGSLILYGPIFFVINLLPAFTGVMIGKDTAQETEVVSQGAATDEIRNEEI